MSDSDRIKPDDASIGMYLEDLRHKRYQIPTFQREVVWERDDIKKLWDSIYRFYPIGSILIWKADIELQKHRRIGGHDIARPDKTNNFQYIIDGQQRTTALLTSLYGVEDEWDGDFDPTLYIDLTIEEADTVETANYSERFLFWDEIETGEGSSSRNVPRKEKYDEGYIVKLSEIQEEFTAIERQLFESGHTDFDDPVRQRLKHIHDVLDKYRVPFIELHDIGISEVTEIFERVNQEGEPLDIFDIVVAKTFRPEDTNEGGFYLRELIDDFRDETDSKFAQISDKRYLTMLAMIIKYHLNDHNVRNITDKFLNNITTEQIEAVWPGAKESFRKAFDFLENELHLRVPQLVPLSYFYITLAVYFYENDDPDYDLLKQHFWFYSFNTQNLLRNTTQLREDHLEWLMTAKEGDEVSFDRFILDRDDLRTATYSYQGRYSRAILSLLAYQEPKDWDRTDRSVLNDVYTHPEHQPNLHHVFPRNFVANYPGDDDYDEDGMMNIVYLTQMTNLDISDRNPVEYVQDYDDGEFREVLETHLIDGQLLEWSRDEEVGYATLDEFIEMRVQNFVEEIKAQLDGIEIDVIDSRTQDTDVRVLIEDGEDQTTEFKSTLRVDLEERGMPESAVEFQCLKAINGFLNAPEGGRLLIGVADDGSIHGIEDDYETFSDRQDREVFRRHFYNLVRSKLEAKYNDFVELSFVTISGSDVCMVEVEQTTDPAFVEHNGDQKFFKRRGNRTIELEPREYQDYISRHFDDE